MKKFSLLLVLAFVAITISAQDNEGVSSEAGRKATFARNGFWDNWFIGAGVGANVFVGDADSKADFMSRPTMAPTVQFGKWYNPYFGARLKASGGSLHNFTYNASKVNMIHSKYVGAEVDVMWNMSNYLCKYNENRFYSFIPFVGIGGMYGWDYNYLGRDIPNKQRSLTVNAGFINNFRLSNRLSLAIEVSGAVLKDDFDKQATGFSYDGLATASASFVYKVGKVGFKEAVLMDQGLIDGLNGQINDLRQENARLSKRPESCPPAKDCPKCPEVSTRPVEKPSFMSNTVFFRLGSATVDSNQEINIHNTAQYLQDNPSAKVRVVGYADKKTGTASINDKLSEKRAKNVANTLINKYNIDSNRVTVEWKGDTEQPYKENAWNRVAIFFAD